MGSFASSAQGHRGLIYLKGMAGDSAQGKEKISEKLQPRLI